MRDTERARRLRLRRALTPMIPEQHAPRWRRALLGVPERDALRLLERLRERHVERRAEVRRHLEQEWAEHGSIRPEIEQMKGQIATLRSRIELLMEQEQAQREQARFEGVRVGADLHRDSQRLSALVAELYRVATTAGTLPPGWKICIPAAPALEPPENEPSVTAEVPGMAAPPEWEPFLLRKRTAKAIKTPGGQLLVKAGETITAETVAAARQRGLLADLLLAVRLD